MNVSRSEVAHILKTGQKQWLKARSNELQKKALDSSTMEVAKMCSSTVRAWKAGASTN